MAQKTELQAIGGMENRIDLLSIHAEQYNEWGLRSWKKFNNPFQEITRGRTFKNFWEFITTNEGNQPKSEAQVDMHLPIFAPNFNNLEGRLKATWIGHSTVVIQDGDVNLIVDPVFGDRASPVTFAGPKRYRRPACTIEQLPIIDAVFVSHDHYDHLDSKALKWFTLNHNPKFFIGLESRDMFPSQAQVFELDWNKPIQADIKGRIYRITFFPVCHWAKRALFDTNQRLWGGFVIQTPTGKKIFYSGDTGYCQVFKQIGDKYGSFDLALIPIGAFLPRPFLSPQHIDPREAVIIHREIHSKLSIGVHWGTFPLGKQHYLAPREELKAAKLQFNVPEAEFLALSHGQSVVSIPRM